MDLARTGVDHHHRAGLRPVVHDGRLERAVGERLEPEVDRQVDVPPGQGRPDVLDVLHAAAETVLDDLLGARDPAKHQVVGELHSFLSRTVDIGEPDDMGRNLPLGVVAPELTLGVHARKREGASPGGGFRVDVAAHVDEGALGALLELAVEGGGVESERRGERRPAVSGTDRFARVHPDGLDGGAHGKRGTVAIADDPARRVRAHRTDVPGRAFVPQEVPLVHLQVQSLPEQPRPAQGEHGQHQPDAPPQRKGSHRPAEPFDSDPGSLRLRDAHASQYSRLTMAMRPGSGRSIPSRVSATRRTRSWDER